MRKKITLVIADDHLIARKGLVQVLEAMEQYTIAGEAENGIELLNLCREKNPDVVITDIRMPGMNGFEAIKQIRLLPQPPAILALSVLEEMEIYELLAAGANAYLDKNARHHEFRETIAAILESKQYYYNFRDAYLKELLASHAYPNLPPATEKFTSRELELMKGLSEGKSISALSKELFITPSTVKYHRNKLYEKTGAKNFIGLLLYIAKNMVSGRYG
ncbi:MAG: response regulator transcription factor [Chitinophagaceae bacterium]|nr:MAG: response regulator transcription factor [Chitinophagaceae bacterium]